MRTPEPATADTGTFNVPANIGNVGGASYRGSITIDVSRWIYPPVAAMITAMTTVKARRGTIRHNSGISGHPIN